jgi:hypothetical protein
LALEAPEIGYDLVKQLLEQMELKYVEDKGDVVVPWESLRMYFVFRGEGDQRIFSVRSFYERRYSVEQKPRLLEILDDWNRGTLWPKAYSETSDDGTVHVIAESHYLVGVAISPEAFAHSMVSWVRAGVDFNNWLADQP